MISPGSVPLLSSSTNWQEAEALTSIESLCNSENNNKKSSFGGSPRLCSSVLTLLRGITHLWLGSG